MEVTDKPTLITPPSAEHDVRSRSSNGYTATMSIGQLALHVLAFVPDRGGLFHIDRLAVAVPQGSHLAPLWPLSGGVIGWPPGPAFDKLGLASVANAWRYVGLFGPEFRVL